MSERYTYVAPAVRLQTFGGRTEVSYTHRDGFDDAKIRVVSAGAHPDDTALDTAFGHVLLNVNNVEKTEMGLAVVTATAGQNGVGIESADDHTRIFEDLMGTYRLGAHLYSNLGYMDGALSWDADSLLPRMRGILSQIEPHIVVIPPPDDPVHRDHLAIQEAVVKALWMNNQNPIVVYTDSQAGFGKPHEGVGRSVGFHITDEEYEVFRAAFVDDHRSQTGIITPDIQDVLSRPQRRAEQMGVPGYAGVVRQDMSFSQEPIETYLGKRAIPIYVRN